MFGQVRTGAEDHSLHWYGQALAPAVQHGDELGASVRRVAPRPRVRAVLVGPLLHSSPLQSQLRDGMLHTRSHTHALHQPNALFYGRCMC